jgi:chemotaxis protein methyltransferase CheR
MKSTKQEDVSLKPDAVLDPTETALLNFINSRLGLVVASTKIAELRQVVEAGCDKYHLTKPEYLQQLLVANSDSPLWKDLISGITVGETYFFRDQKQMQLLQETVLPHLILAKRKSGDLSLRIWSAGCASGEELYSIIILLNEMLTDIAQWRLKFLGTDINITVLQKALSGRYSEWSMRSIAPFYKNKYLRPDDSSYVLREDIVARADFTYLNLNESFPSIINGTNAQDLIICRNVLIYFDDVHIKEIMQKLCQSLTPGGYLLLGASDPVLGENNELLLQPEYGKLFIRGTPFTTISKALAPAPAATLAPPALAAASLPQLARQSRWQEIINIIDQAPQPEAATAAALAAKATALANLGKLTAAVRFCEESIALDSLRLETYFTYAIILIGLNDTANAEAALRKTLFLDNNFVLGHYQLGLLLINNKQILPGVKALKNAFDIAQRTDPALPVIGYNDLTFGKLAAVLQEEIALYHSLETKVDER